MYMGNDEKAKQWARIVAKAWADEDFKRRLLAEPAAVLKEEGVEVPAGVKLQVIENTESTMNLVLPAMPKDVGNLQDMDRRLAADDCAVCGY